MLKDNLKPMIIDVRSHNIATVSLAPTFLVTRSRQWRYSIPISDVSRAVNLVAHTESNVRRGVALDACGPVRHIAGTLEKRYHR